MKVEEGKFYFIKQEFFEKVKNELSLKNKGDENKSPCYYCFKDLKNSDILWFIPISSKVERYSKIYNYKLQKYKVVDNIVFGYVEGQKRAFLIQNMFLTTEEYIKQNRYVNVNNKLKREIERKANKILKLVEKGYKGLVFSDILKAKEKLKS